MKIKPVRKLSDSLEITANNLRKYLRSSNFNCTAKIINCEFKGYISQVYTTSGTFYILYKISPADRLIVFELSVSVHCPAKNEYSILKKLAEINSAMNVSNFRIDENGHIYLHTEYIFIENPVSVNTLKEITDFMIRTAVKHLPEITSY